MGYFGFDQLNIQYLEPPENTHHSECENKRWYWCAECVAPFIGDSSDGTPVNMHTGYQVNNFQAVLCNSSFNAVYDECVCEWLGE